MSAAAPNTRREEIHFPPNTPVTLALKYAQGKQVSGINGERIMFTTLDNRVFFVDIDVAAQIETLGVNVRETFTLTKHWDSKRESAATWEVTRTIGEQPNGTFVVPRSHDSESASARVEAKLPASAVTAQPATIRKPVATTALADEAEALVDTFAEVLKRALDKHQGRVKPDEVKSLLITAYIQRNRLTSAA